MYVESGGDEGCERGEGVGEGDSYVSTCLGLSVLGYVGLMMVVQLCGDHDDFGHR